jgi:hypothetical protein
MQQSSGGLSARARLSADGVAHLDTAPAVFDAMLGDAVAGPLPEGRHHPPNRIGAAIRALLEPVPVGVVGCRDRGVHRPSPVRSEAEICEHLDRCKIRRRFGKITE